MNGHAVGDAAGERTSYRGRRGKVIVPNLTLLVALVVGLLSFGATPVANAATFTVNNGDVAGLIAAIKTANGNSQADTINLAAGATYTLTGVDNTTGGSNGLPPI